jgi:hypothetical protein
MTKSALGLLWPACGNAVVNHIQASDASCHRSCSHILKLVLGLHNQAHHDVAAHPVIKAKKVIHPCPPIQSHSKSLSLLKQEKKWAELLLTCTLAI